MNRVQTSAERKKVRSTSRNESALTD